MMGLIKNPNWIEKCFSYYQDQMNPSWFIDFKAKQFQKFLQYGFPKRNDEAWKYTPVNFLKDNTFENATTTPLKQQSILIKNILQKRGLKEKNVLFFVNGHFAEIQNNFLPKGIVLCSLKEAMVKHESLLKKNLLKEFHLEKNPFSAFNLALLTDGVLIHIQKNVIAKDPIHLIFLSTESNVAACLRNIILMEEDSQIKIVEEYISEKAENYFNNTLTDISVGKNANLDYYKIQNESLSATHLSETHIVQQAYSQVKTHFFSYGAKLEREDLSITQEAEYAKSDMLGFYKLQYDHQHTDHHLEIKHAASHGESRMLYKGILDKKSKGVFNGKVWVKEKVKKINAYQANHNLMLSDLAEMNTKPELEIYARDVKCAHGATIGRLNEQAIFYFRARGIPESEAIKLLTKAFSDEIVNQLEDNEIKSYIKKVENHECL